MIGHASPISGIATSGGFVATAGYDNRVVLWDAKTRTAVGVVNHDHLVNQCTFSPDGKLLATASSDYTARLWSIPSLRLLAVFNDHEDDVEMVAFDPNATRLATASRDHNARIFDLGGRLLAKFEGHQADVISVAWSHVGEELITSGDDGTVRWWDVGSRTQSRRIDMEDAETDTIALLEDDVVLAGNDRGELVLITNRGSTTVKAHAAGVKRVQHDPRSGLAVSTSYDRAVSFWRRSDSELLLVAKTVAPPPVWVRSVAVGGDGTLLFPTFGGGYSTFDIARGQWEWELYRESVGINAVIIAEGQICTVGDAGQVLTDGNPNPLGRPGSLCNFLARYRGRLITGGQIGVLFDVESGSALYTHHSPLNCASVVGADDSGLVVGSYTGDVLKFTNNLSAPSIFRIHKNAIKGLAVSGESLFSVCANGDVAIHHITDMRCIRHVSRAHTRIANGACAIGEKGFASVSRDLTLRLWALDGAPTDVLATPHQHSIKCVATDNSGHLVATGAYDGTVAIVDLRTHHWTCTRPTTAGISSLAFDRLRRRFVAGSYDGHVTEVC